MRTGNRMAAVQLSDPTGSYEGGALLRGARRISRPPRARPLGGGAGQRRGAAGGINVRIQSVEPLDKFMAGLKQIRVFLRDGAPLPSLEKHLGRKGRGRGQPHPAAAGGPARGRGQPAGPICGYTADRKRPPRREGRGAGGTGVMTAGFPVFDLSRFAAASDGGRSGVSAPRSTQSAAKPGFSRYRGHGVPQQMIDGLSGRRRAPFSTCRSRSKLAAKAPYPGYPYGYLPPQAEALAKSRNFDTPPDLKESFNGGPLVVPEGLTDPQALGFCYAPTIWPAEPAGFADAWRAYYRAMEGPGAPADGLFAVALDLRQNPSSIRSSISRSARFAHSTIHEPKAPPLPGQLRAGAHSDYGSLTILLPEAAPGGLEILHAGRIVAARSARPGAFIINIGDLMARWTNDRWVSTTPPRGQSRLPMPRAPRGGNRWPSFISRTGTRRSPACRAALLPARRRGTSPSAPAPISCPSSTRR